MGRVVGLRVEKMVNTLTYFEVSHSVHPYISKHLLIVPTKYRVFAHLLRLWVRIPPGAWMFVVSVVCCQVDELITCPEESCQL
jgi:hypothetical protein